MKFIKTSKYGHLVLNSIEIYILYNFTNKKKYKKMHFKKVLKNELHYVFYKIMSVILHYVFFLKVLEVFYNPKKLHDTFFFNQMQEYTYFSTLYILHFKKYNKIKLHDFMI